MTHHTSRRFWSSYAKLPKDIQALADKSYKLMELNPQHPSLHMKKVGKMWSVPVGRDHRAVAVEVEDGFRWVWIGTHAEYDRMV